MSDPQQRKTSPLALAIAWIVVMIPLAWGVYQTAFKALPLFAGSTARATPPSSPGTNPEKPAGDRQRWAGEPTEDNVESSVSSPRQPRRELA